MMRASTASPGLRLGRASGRTAWRATQKWPFRWTRTHRVPLLFGGADEHAVAHEAGVVDDHVEAAEGVERRLHERAGAVPVGDVVAVGDRLAAGGADLVDDLAAPGRVEPPRPSSAAPRSLTTTLAPSARERERVGAAEPAPGAGDDHDAAVADPASMPRRQSRSMMVTLAWPPPSHIVCRP